MKVFPIRDALSGEHVLAVSPALRPAVQEYAKRRLNAYPGRQLTAAALTAEQDGRAARLGLYGRLIAPGVVDGLGTTLDPNDSNVLVGAGLGITSSGEDVSLAEDRRLVPRSLPVYTPAVEQLPPGAPANPVLDDFIGTPAELPPAGILILRPVTAEILREDPQDPCETDQSDAAFEDQLRLDGVRFMFHPWPDDWLSLPPRGEGWRNRLAHAIFNREAQLAPGEDRPWDEAGVAVGLIAFDDAWNPLFVDRYSVIRAAGRRLPCTVRSSELTPAGEPRLWQARIHQFAEHLGALADPVVQFPAEFEELPPIGLLPREFLDLGPTGPSLFTAELGDEDAEASGDALLSLTPIRTDAGALTDVRIVLEIAHRFNAEQPQLDLEELFIQRLGPRQILADFAGVAGGRLPAAGTLRLDMNLSDLQSGSLEAAEEFLASDGDTGFELFFEVVNGSRQRLRGELRRRFRATSPVLNGRLADAAPIPVEQLDAVFRESMSQAPLSATDRVRLLVPVPQSVYDPRLLVKDEPDPEFRSFITEKVADRDDLLARRGEVRRKQNALHQAIHGEDLEFPDPDPEANPDEEPPRVNAPAQEPDFGTQPRAGGGFIVQRLAEFNERTLSNAPVRPADRELLDPNSPNFAGFAKFIDNIKTHIQKADDSINIGFTRVKADVYRVLQFVVGEAEATRLATSPALAAIAKTASANVAGEQIRQYYEAARQQQIPPRETTPSTGPTGPVSSGGSPINFGSEISFPGTLASPLVPSARKLNLFSAGQLEAQFISQVKQPEAPDITGESPLVGKSEIRDTTIASRLEAPRSTESRDYALASKFQVYSNLRALELNLDDVEVPGVSQRRQTGPGQPQVFLANPIQLQELDLDSILNEPQAHLGDEAAFFANSAELTEHTVAALRAAEGRVDQYRQLLKEAEKARQDIEDHKAQAADRLEELAESLAEARHDVNVARTLLDEEQRRVDAVNKRREEIIAKHVKFLAYHRPGTVERAWRSPVHTLDPGVTDLGEPRCLSEDASVPDELHSVVDLFRDAPVKWFPAVQRLLERVDRLEVFQGWLSFARRRAAQTPSRALRVSPVPAGRRSFATAITNVFQARQAALGTYRAQTARLDLSAVALQSWRGARQTANEVVSLGDVIEGGHGRQSAAQQASRELERIERAAACLYEGFGNVAPLTRLIWAEQLSQFDEPVNMRNLQTLPRWNTVDVLQRRELQAVVDFLYQRISFTETEASELVSDLVRSAILVASHAPVDQIVEGRVEEPSDVRKDGPVRLRVDVSRVRIGMNVLLYSGRTTAARAVVEDINQGLAVTRIVQVMQPGVRLAAQARAQFLQSNSLRLLG